MKVPREAWIIGAQLLGVLLVLQLVKEGLKAGAGAVGDAANKVNPLNRDNVFAGAANSATEAVTGDPSLGGYLHDFFHGDPFNRSSFNGG